MVPCGIRSTRIVNHSFHPFSLSWVPYGIRMCPQELRTFPHSQSISFISVLFPGSRFLGKNFTMLLAWWFFQADFLKVLSSFLNNSQKIGLCKLFNTPLTTVLEKAMAPHSSTPAWKIPWTEEPGRLWSTGSLRVGHDWATSLWLFTFMHWRRKWQPLQCSCLENPRDWGAWWTAVCGVAQSRTQLKWLRPN